MVPVNTNLQCLSCRICPGSLRTCFFLSGTPPRVRDTSSAASASLDVSHGADCGTWCPRIEPSDVTCMPVATHVSPGCSSAPQALANLSACLCSLRSLQKSESPPAIRRFALSRTLHLSVAFPAGFRAGAPLPCHPSRVPFLAFRGLRAPSLYPTVPLPRPRLLSPLEHPNPVSATTAPQQLNERTVLLW